MLISLANAPREYSWGSRTLLPELTGRPPRDVPEAEIWYGDHPGCPARTPDGRALDDVLRAHGEPPLPYLMKLLAAGSSLSIQAHPSKREAVEGCAREDAAGIDRDAASRNYRDDNHKPEIIVALSDRFRALVGLRPLAATRALLAPLAESAPAGEPAATGEGVGALLRRLDTAGRSEADTLRAVIAWALSGRAAPEVAALEHALHATAERAGDGGEELAVLRGIARDFPGDPGLIVAALMNLVVLRRGEALFAPAGVLHAYQDGLGVEVMAASDNVLRGGLTPKHVDVDELLRVVDTSPGAPPLVAPVGDDGARVFDVGIPDFRVRHVEVGDAGHRLVTGGPAMVLATRGTVTVAAGGDEVVLAPAEAVLALGETAVTVRGDGEVFVAEPGA
ncbi:mannose-6-phosphate isomerase, class I [Microbacterium sp. No. 7]|uniref:mannose-6-phosphate isomerase, class I n=1 Tax=Microbacterium sp. No. 7 TaxID=1714373 RepID=UPI0006D25CAA|nr:mannose-6-phosphate isomerase, class I [Microbacterium sp. No. 7]